jgi:hypothetical protein
MQYTLKMSTKWRFNSRTHEAQGCGKQAHVAQLVDENGNKAFVGEADSAFDAVSRLRSNVQVECSTMMLDAMRCINVYARELKEKKDARAEAGRAEAEEGLGPKSD